MNSLIVVGSGGHAGSVADAARSAGFSIIGFFDPSAGSTPVEPGVLDSLGGIDLDEVGLALGIGANYSREDSYTAIKNSYPAAQFPAIVHSSAWVSPLATLGAGAVVMSLASVGPSCAVGVGTVINTGSSLDHDSQMKPFASLGPGARTGGNVTIGERTMVGLNAAVLQGVSVGRDSVVGAQSLVTRNLGGNVVAFGSPAEVRRERNASDPYY